MPVLVLQTSTELLGKLPAPIVPTYFRNIISDSVHFLVLDVCFIVCVFCVFVLFCVLFLLLYIAVCFLFLCKFTDCCHRMETQLQKICIISYHIYISNDFHGLLLLPSSGD
jgi:hypothetical protein